MLDYKHAQTACEHYIDSLVHSRVEDVLALFDDQATIEDPVGSGVKTGKEALHEFYTIACNGVTGGRLTGPVRLAGNEVAFAFELTIGAGDKAMVMDIIDVFTFNDAGKVVAMRAFWGKDNMRPAI